MSVDPLADKYIHSTPYLYCEGNPVIYKDPDGQAVHIAVGAIVGAVVGGTIAGIAAAGDPSKDKKGVLGAIAGGVVSGAITGGLAAATGGATLIAGLTTSIVAGGIGEAAGSVVSQGIEKGSVDGGEVARAAAVGTIVGGVTGAASKAVGQAVNKSGVVKRIETDLIKGVKTGSGKAAKQQANQAKKAITDFCSPAVKQGERESFQMKDLLTYPADVVGQQVATGVTTSKPVTDFVNGD